MEEFKERAEILLATESGAEGLNMQFCNVVVNYDLPWNPQRVEQRIGRCHRYGQKYDVVVINFLNTANAADQRVLELLKNKLNLCYLSPKIIMDILEYRNPRNMSLKELMNLAEGESNFERQEKEWNRP